MSLYGKGQRRSGGQEEVGSKLGDAKLTKKRPGDQNPRRAGRHLLPSSTPLNPLKINYSIVDSIHPGLASDTLRRVHIFQGVKYHICPSLPDWQQLRHILESNGAQEASNLKVATRIITEVSHSIKGALVTWVYSSVKAGVKQPARYYSVDPAMFFSSLVVSAIEVSPAHADLIGIITKKYGGQWKGILTDNVTHVIADSMIQYLLEVVREGPIFSIVPYAYCHVSRLFFMISEPMKPVHTISYKQRDARRGAVRTVNQVYICRQRRSPDEFVTERSGFR
ncbi:hypothetical protein C8R44DRAFT_855432 [Mycena epipterygia]|nr:hypothetical protein C8R44DRAFT_855432 [Mycena epipterygia]